MISTYRHVTPDLFDRIVGGAFHDDIAEQRLDTHRTGVILHGHLIDVQRLERGNAQLGQPVDQIRSQVIERAADAHVQLGIGAAARQHVRGCAGAGRRKGLQKGNSKRMAIDSCI